MNTPRYAAFGARVLGTALVLGLISAGFLVDSVLSEQTGGAGGAPLAGSIHVKVVEPDTDDGTGNPLPVPGAFVMVGVMAGNPFTGNYGFADANGEITFTDASLVGPQTVTAGADGYQYFSFVNVDASEIVIPLHVKDPVFQRSRISGGATGFSGIHCDNLLQMVLFSVPSTVGSIMGLSQTGQATEKETATILGSTVYMDSNIVIPMQKEEPLLFCASWWGLDCRKDSYSLYLPTGTTQNISAVGLEFPLTESFGFGQINTLKLGLVRNYAITGNSTLNVSLTHSVSKNLTLNVANTPAGTNVLLMSLGEINGDPALAPGGGELLTLGFGELAGGGSASASVNTIARTSPFQDLRYVALASAAYPEGSSQTGETTVLDRGDYLPPATRSLSSFLLPVQLDPVTGNLFSFSNTYNPGISPQPDVNFTTLALVTTVPDTSPGAGSGDTVDISETLWRLVSPGEDLAFYLPLLPPEAPEALPDPSQTPEDDRLVWRQNVFVMGLDPAFDFDSFGLSQIAESITHYSLNERVFSLNVDCFQDADCDDGNACNGLETCVAGVCQAGTPLVCDDGNVCTDDSCDPAVGCVFVNNTAPCDDGNACTTGDTCSGGVCAGGPPLVCDDGNLCTDNTCDPALGCVSVNNTAPCDDGNACTTDDTCSGGVCAGGPPLVCDDGNLCTDNTCDPASGCVFVNNTAPCDDGNACTTDDTCSGGVCASGPPLVCDDGVFCNGEEWCDPALGCRPGTPPDCDDGIPCTENFCDEVTDACAFTDHCAGIYVNPSCPGSARPEDLIEIPVTITDAGGVDLLGFDVSYDAGVLEYLGYGTGDCLLDDWLDVACGQTAGVVSCDASSATPLPGSSTGCLVNLSFQVLPGTGGGFTQVAAGDLRDDLQLMSTTPCGIHIDEVMFNILDIVQDWDGSRDVTLTWESVAGASYGIHVKDGLADPFTLVDTVSGAPDTTSWTDDGTRTGSHPGTVQQRYYKVVGGGVDSGNVVGLFKITLHEGMNLISVPLVPFGNALEDVLGAQVTGADNEGAADRVWVWTGTNYAFAWLIEGVGPPYDGKWYSGNHPTTLTLDADQGVWLQIRPGHGPVDVSFLGEVPDANRSIPVHQGMNLIGTSYPVSVPLGSTNLWESGMAGADNEGDSDRIWSWQGDRYEFYWLVDGVGPPYDGQWYMGNSPVSRSLEPGRGYWLQRRDGHGEFTWDYERPY